MHVHRHAYTKACILIHTSTYINIYIKHAYTNTRSQAYIHVNMHAYTLMLMHKHPHMYTNKRVHVYIRTHAQTHDNMRTYTNTCVNA